eukprot:6203791-Pleurochrysis_carterae.AAC.1
MEYAGGKRFASRAEFRQKRHLLGLQDRDVQQAMRLREAAAIGLYEMNRIEVRHACSDSETEHNIANIVVCGQLFLIKLAHFEGKFLIGPRRTHIHTTRTSINRQRECTKSAGTSSAVEALDRDSNPLEVTNIFRKAGKPKLTQPCMSVLGKNAVSDNNLLQEKEQDVQCTLHAAPPASATEAPRRKRPCPGLIEDSSKEKVTDPDSSEATNVTVARIAGAVSTEVAKVAKLG